VGSSFYTSKEREEGRAEVVRDRALFVLLVVHMHALGGLAPHAQKEYHGGYIVVFRDMNADILRLAFRRPRPRPRKAEESTDERDEGSRVNCSIGRSIWYA
jgi:hypothetical protein